MAGPSVYEPMCDFSDLQDYSSVSRAASFRNVRRSNSKKQLGRPRDESVVNRFKSIVQTYTSSKNCRVRFYVPEWFSYSWRLPSKLFDT
eukprot:g15317.t1